MGDLCLHSIETDVLDGYVIRIQTPSYDSKRPRRSISAGTFNASYGSEHMVGILLTVNDASDLVAIADVLTEAANQILNRRLEMPNINPDGSPVLIETVVYRYGVAEIHEHESIDEAQSFIANGEEYGYFSSLGVFVDGEPHSGQLIDEMRKAYAEAVARRHAMTLREMRSIEAKEE